PDEGADGTQPDLVLDHAGVFEPRLELCAALADGLSATGVWIEAPVILAGVAAEDDALAVGKEAGPLLTTRLLQEEVLDAGVLEDQVFSAHRPQRRISYKRAGTDPGAVDDGRCPPGHVAEVADMAYVDRDPGIGQPCREMAQIAGHVDQ